MLTQKVEKLIKQYNIIYNENDIEKMANNITLCAGDIVDRDMTSRYIYTLYRLKLLDKNIALNMSLTHISKKESIPNISCKKIFDPFDNYNMSGYLNNTFKTKNLEIVKKQEHETFLINMQEAMDYLATITLSEYNWQIVANVHRILFSDFYPWAGIIHDDLFPDLVISKGHIIFAYPGHIKDILDYTFNKFLKQSNNDIREHIGDILSCLCYSHPFLDGNGRTLLLILYFICDKSGFCIDLSKSKSINYLEALTEDLEHPNNILNRYLKDFIIKK